VGPELAAALTTAAERPDRAEDAFEFGLAVLLRGLGAPARDRSTRGEHTLLFGNFTV
jgi:hypothetical protein